MNSWMLKIFTMESIMTILFLLRYATYDNKSTTDNIMATITTKATLTLIHSTLGLTLFDLISLAPLGSSPLDHILQSFSFSQSSLGPSSFISSLFALLFLICFSCGSSLVPNGLPLASTRLTWLFLVFRLPQPWLWSAPPWHNSTRFTQTWFGLTSHNNPPGNR